MNPAIGSRTNHGDTKPDFTASWVVGWLTLNSGNNVGRPQKNNSDNTNTLFLMKSLLWPYHQSLGVWKCPADKALSTIGNQRYAHVRTMSMNAWVGDYDPKTKKEYSPAWTPGFRIIKKVSEMTEPAPGPHLRAAR